jgi:hypothetical protein
VDDRPDAEDEGLPPIGFSSHELAMELVTELDALRERGQELDDETIMVFVAAAIETNNRRLYEDLRSLGVIVEPDRADDDADAAAAVADEADGVGS